MNHKGCVPQRPARLPVIPARTTTGPIGAIAPKPDFHSRFGLRVPPDPFAACSRATSFVRWRVRQQAGTGAALPSREPCLAGRFGKRSTGIRLHASTAEMHGAIKILAGHEWKAHRQAAIHLCGVLIECDRQATVQKTQLGSISQNRVQFRVR